MFWGFTPALDLLSTYKDIHKSLPKQLNILLVGGSDVRHILKTLSRRYRYEDPPRLNFYILEACQETVAKQLLLLYIALQPDTNLALAQKTRTFMELYGNSLLRPSTATYLHTTAADLVNMITDYGYLNEVMPFVDFDLKYKDRDYLENLFKFWCSSDDFDILDCWDRRLRKHLGVRFDSKLGAFDWDLHMGLHPQGAKQICNQEYRNWRLNGVAFTWLESEVSKSNRSLVCGVIPNGNRFAHYGYLGDMETGPFLTYGLECEDEAFLKRTHTDSVHRATDVIERNLKQIFHEIEMKDVYVHQAVNDHQLGTVVMQLANAKVVDVKAKGERCRKCYRKCIDLKDVNVKFVSFANLNSMRYKQDYKEFFDVMYFGCNYLKYVDKEVLEVIARKGALLIIENVKFVVCNKKKEKLQEFKDNISSKVENLKCEHLPFDVSTDNNAVFVLSN